MPRIPIDSYYPQADVGAAQPFRMDSNAPLQGATIVGDQMQGLGNSMQRLGAEGTKIATDFQDQINQNEVLGLRNKMAQFANVMADDPKDGWKSKLGEAAYKGPDDGSGMTTQDIYLQKYNEQRAALESGLQNDRQRLMAKPYLDDMATQLQTQLNNHALEQFKAVRLSNLNGTFKLSVDAAQRAGTDPSPEGQAALMSNLMQAQSAVADAGRFQGKAPTEIANDVKMASSTVHTKVIDSLLEQGKVTDAQAYFNKFKDPVYEYRGDDGLVHQTTDMHVPGAQIVSAGITTNDMLGFQSKLIRANDQQFVQTAIAQTAQKFSNQAVPTDTQRLLGLVGIQESGNKDFGKDGAPVTSPKGAMYRMQVMPATAADPGFGIKPAANNSPQEYNRVGEQLMQSLVQKYQGNIPLALAAYNAGSGTVDNALKTSGQNWMSAMPKETQAYVYNINKAYAGGQGAAPMPTEEQFVADALSNLDDNQRNRPQLVQMIQAAAVSRYGILAKSVQATKDQAFNDVLRATAANGGDFSAVPATMQSRLLALDPNKYDDALKFAKNVSKGENVTNLVEYNNAVTNPQLLAKMTDAQFNSYMLTNFSQTDAKKIIDLRNNEMNGVEGGGNLRTKMVNDAINNRIVSIGIPLTTVKSPMEDQQRMGSMRRFAQDFVLDQQKSLGRNMNQAEVEKTVDSLFAKNVNFQTSYLGGLWKSPSDQNMMSLTVKDIPPDSLAGIQSSFAKQGITKPTNDQLMRAYWAWKIKG